MGAGLGAQVVRDSLARIGERVIVVEDSNTIPNEISLGFIAIIVLSLHSMRVKDEGLEW